MSQFQPSQQVNLSQIIPRKVRRIIPVYVFNNTTNTYDELTIEVYNPSALPDKLQDLQSRLKNKTNEEAFLEILKEFTNITVDEENIDNINDFFSYFSETSAALQEELYSILAEIQAYSIDSMNKFLNMPDDQKAKQVAFNPKMAEVFDNLKRLNEDINADINNIEAEEVETEVVEEIESTLPSFATPTEEELEAIHKAEELKFKYGL